MSQGSSAGRGRQVAATGDGPRAATAGGDGPRVRRAAPRERLGGLASCLLLPAFLGAGMIAGGVAGLVSGGEARALAAFVGAAVLPASFMASYLAVAYLWSFLLVLALPVLLLRWLVGGRSPLDVPDVPRGFDLLVPLGVGGAGGLCGWILSSWAPELPTVLGGTGFVYAAVGVALAWTTSARAELTDLTEAP